MLSIVIPTLNEEFTIKNILNNIKNQSFKNVEIIIIDGNSDDKTKEIAREYIKKLDLKIINSKIRNVGYQRNLGAKKAKSELILFLDADCSFESNFLEKALEEIKLRNLDFAGCPLYPDNEHTIDKLFYFLFRQFIKVFYKFIGVNGCCIFVLKKLHDKINGFDEAIKVSEDFDYVRKLKKITKISLLNSVYVKTSVRRFQKYGRFKTGIKLVLIGFYTLFFGKITTDIFKYRFNGKN